MQTGPIQPSTRSYRVVVGTQLEAAEAAWLDDVLGARDSVHPGNGITVIVIRAVDQAALRGLLSRLWDLNLTVLSVNAAVESSVVSKGNAEA